MAAKAIETQYKGYRFRSRLEARWAVFFDALNLRWDYEKEGYEFSDGTKYLPDFYLPEMFTWVEIKPLEWAGGYWPDRDAMDKAGKLAEATLKRVVIICGSPGLFPSFSKDQVPYEAYVFFGTSMGNFDNGYLWCECPSCKEIGIEFDGRAARILHKPDCPVGKACRERHDDPRFGQYDKVCNIDSERLRAAFEAARSARFEHGERG
jgi:hypothetical protein